MKTDWGRIEAFIGYGRIDAPVVFIGMEEGVFDSNTLDAELALRSRYADVMDLKESFRGFEGAEKYFSDSPPRQPAWRVMADVMLHYEKRVPDDAGARKSARTLYRAKRLGRDAGDTLLVELRPYPSKSTSEWPYADRFATREAYEKEVLPKRFRLLTKAMADYKRSAIICYGKGDWTNYKALFPNVQWVFSGEFECATWCGTPITLTKHLSRFFNSNEELDDLSKVALRHGD